VKLGDLDAYRYANLEPKGFDERLTVYVSPTTAGVVTVACTAAAADAKAFLPECEEVAGLIKLIDGKALPLGADEEYVQKLDKAIDELNSDRKRDVQKLRKAKKQSSQGSAASALAADYAQARKALAGGAVSPAVKDSAASVAGALRQAQAAYRRMASAARSGNTKAYNAAKKDATAAERKLKRALTEVEQAGG
jgi:hypothetical protein